MQKKILKTAFALTLCAACALGVSACSNSNGDGEETEKEPVTTVTAEEWKTAFEKVNAAENYTAEITMNMQNSENGPQTATAYFTPDVILRQSKSSDGDKEIVINNYFIKDNGEDYYVYNDPTDTDKWSGLKQKGLFSAAIQQSMPYATQKFAKSGSDDYSLLIDLYSEFSYNDGAYCASSLYVEGFSSVVYEITLKFTDGYLTYISTEGKSSSVTNTIIMDLSDYGTTTVTLPASTQEAFEKIKKESN